MADKKDIKQNDRWLRMSVYSFIVLLFVFAGCLPIVIWGWVKVCSYYIEAGWIAFVAILIIFAIDSVGQSETYWYFPRPQVKKTRATK